jgi:endo-1,4-beta-xylanase
MAKIRVFGRVVIAGSLLSALGLGCSSGNAANGGDSNGGTRATNAAGGQTTTNDSGSSDRGGDANRTSRTSNATATGGLTNNATNGGSPGTGERGGGTSSAQSGLSRGGSGPFGGGTNGNASSAGGNATAGSAEARGSANGAGGSSTMLTSAGGASNRSDPSSAGSIVSSGGTKSTGGTSAIATSANAGTSSAVGSSAATGGTTSSKPPTYGGGGATSLGEKYKDLFPIGAAVDSQSYNTHATLLKKHFNSVTPENEMKFDALHPNENTYTWTAADNIVNFATSNNMKIRGHALVWHRQTPAWVFNPATRDSVLAKMQAHINSVMTHYKGKVYAWDVVNEAIMDDGHYRNGDEPNDDQKSQWYKIVGVDYIAEAFKYAHAADPSAKLFYNDYYNYVPARREAIYSMLKGLLDKQVPLHGVGLQAHFNIEPSTVTTHQAYYQRVEELEKAIELYASLGLEVQITEMDVSLYVPGVTYTSDQFYTAATFTDALQAKQAERYRDFFNLYRKHRDVITGVTLWGIADDNTWLSEFTSGRKDFPLLFDTNQQPKKAYYAVVDF